MKIYDRLDALTTPARIRILSLLSREELGVGEVTQVVQLPQSTVSRHLKVLTKAGWAQSRRVGNSILFIRSTELSDSDQTMWTLIQQETEGQWADDHIRLKSILEVRESSSRDFFGRIAGRWQEVRRELYGERSLTHLLLSLLPRGQVIADLGCGAGDLIEQLAPVVDRVIGVDREPAMLEAARARLHRFAHVDLREGRLESPPLRERELDLAMFNLVLHLVKEPIIVLSAVARALQSGGKIVILDMVAHDRKIYRRTMGHIHLGFNEDTLRGYAEQSGLILRDYRTLPSDLSASGPSLFIAIFER